MTEKIPNKAELQEQLDQATEVNEDLAEENQALLNKQADMDARLERMEAFMDEQSEAGAYEGPKPKIYHDPFDCINPHKFKCHPEGLRFSWKNPRIMEDQGPKGWSPVTWDSEIGRDIDTYLASPPAKMEGIATQDNYVRRGVDSILCVIKEEIWLARQQKRESKALRKQMAANARANVMLGDGVETFGDGVKREPRPVGGFKPREELPVPHGGHRTRLFHPDEE